MKKATFDNPHEYWEQMRFLNTKLLAIWFFDSSSGNLYAKVDPIKIVRYGSPKPLPFISPAAVVAQP